MPISIPGLHNFDGIHFPGWELATGEFESSVGLRKNDLKTEIFMPHARQGHLCQARSQRSFTAASIYWTSGAVESAQVDSPLVEMEQRRRWE